MAKRKLPKRDMHILQIQRRINRLEANKAEAIRMLVRAENELPSLHKQLARLWRKPPSARFDPVTVEDIEREEAVIAQEVRAIAADNIAQEIKEIEDKRIVQEIIAAPQPPVVVDPPDIPDYLKRDASIAKELREEQERIRKAKAAARIDKMLANKSGARRAMPLQGKDALKAIMGG